MAALPRQHGQPPIPAYQLPLLDTFRVKLTLKTRASSKCAFGVPQARVPRDNTGSKMAISNRHHGLQSKTCKRPEYCEI